MTENVKLSNQFASLEASFDALADNIKETNSQMRQTVADLYDKSDRSTRQINELKIEMSKDLNQGFESIRLIIENRYNKMHDDADAERKEIHARVAIVETTLVLMAQGIIDDKKNHEKSMDEQTRRFNRNISIAAVALTAIGVIIAVVVK